MPYTHKTRDDPLLILSSTTFYGTTTKKTLQLRAYPQRLPVSIGRE